MVQLWEGEYVMYSQPTAMQGGIIRLAGEVRHGIKADVRNPALLRPATAPADTWSWPARSAG